MIGETGNTESVGVSTVLEDRYGFIVWTSLRSILPHNQSLRVLSSEQRLSAERVKTGAETNSPVISLGKTETRAMEARNRNPLAKLA